MKSMAASFLALIISFALLIYMAGWLGNPTAAFILGILTAGILLAVGQGSSVLQNHIATKRQQADFVNNARENLAIMQQMQSIQNQQNTQLMRQVKQAPQPALPETDFVIDDAIFSQLED